MNPQYKLHTFSDGTTNETQLQSIYDLNQANTPEVGSLESMNHLKQLIELSAYNLLALDDDEVIGFIICMRESSGYGSENYKFFTQRLKKFLYVDRIAIDEQHRKAGLGQAIYENIFVQARIIMFIYYLSNAFVYSKLCDYVYLSSKPQIFHVPTL